MCFYRVPEVAYAQVLKDPVMAFKILKKTNEGLFSPTTHLAPCKWDIGRMKHDQTFERVTTITSINKGLHCLKTLEDAKSYRSSLRSWADFKIYKVLIPRGALYWENATQICTDQMTVVDGVPVVEFVPVVKKVVKRAVVKKPVKKKK